MGCGVEIGCFGKTGGVDTTKGRLLWWWWARKRNPAESHGRVFWMCTCCKHISFESDVDSRRVDVTVAQESSH